MTLSHRIASRVLAAVAAHQHVDVLELRSSGRSGALPILRGQAMWVMRQAGLNPDEVGTLFNRDGATVLTVCETVERRRADALAAVYRQEVDALLAVALTVIEEAKKEVAPSSTVLPTSIVAMIPTDRPVAREPRLFTLLKTGRDECRQKAQDLHRLSMLFDAAIIRLEAGEEQPVTVNAQRSSEEIP